ncbi:MAG: S1 RNA-binding domain-containing protein, partial [Gammaproteobacteria bacterium]|nr:S1 RNA-binding domain-containing protein [Gammaproteobacteria bacterium]MCB1881251.1 S1 RNA-binding domain-containing protein [Gammaproteobacteria bacterium]
MTTQEDFSALLREFEKEHAGTATPAPAIGDKVRGRVISIQGDYAFVDLGAKTEGAVEIAELTDADGNLSVAIGDPIEIIVSGKDEDSGTLLLGARHARRAHGSEGLRQAYEQQTPVEGRVSGVLKGGVEVEISGERAFCPASQIDIQYVEDLQSYVGEKLAFRITKFESGRSTNLVVSRRALLEEERQT